MTTSTIDMAKERIEKIQNKDVKIIAKFQLITACRISEAIGKYAITKNDLAFTEFKGNTLVLITLKTAKRNGIPRIIALPINKEPPWIKDIIDYAEHKQGTQKLFKYSLFTIEDYFKNIFLNLNYFVEGYTIIGEPKIQGHERQMTSHALRHLRLSELVNKYGFDDIDLATFAGWKMKGMAGRYVTSAWGRYIDKLL